MERNYGGKFQILADFIIGFFGGIFLNFIISTYFLYLYVDLNVSSGEYTNLLLVAIIIFLIELTLLIYAMLRTFKLNRKYIGYGIASMLALPAIIIVFLIIGLF